MLRRSVGRSSPSLCDFSSSNTDSKIVTQLQHFGINGLLFSEPIQKVKSLWYTTSTLRNNNNSNISLILKMNLLESKSICLQNLFLKTRCKTEHNEQVVKPSKDKFRISDLILIRGITSDKTLSGKLDPINKLKSISQYDIRYQGMAEKKKGLNRQKLVFFKFFHAKKAINPDLRSHTVQYKKKRQYSNNQFEKISSFSMLGDNKMPIRNLKNNLDGLTLAQKDILLTNLKQRKEMFEQNTLPRAKRTRVVEVIADPISRSNARKNKWIL